MKNTADKLAATIERIKPLLLQMPEGETSVRPAEGKWSPVEIMGHLIDSAANNHQRFVRAMSGITDMGPYRYDQNHWVASQNYANANWEAVVQLWYAYNLHLSHVIRQIPEELGQVQLSMGPEGMVSLEFVVTDYLDHLEHHLRTVIANFQ